MSQRSYRFSPNVLVFALPCPALPCIMMCRNKIVIVTPFSYKPVTEPVTEIAPRFGARQGSLELEGF
jgi:hypothetical protein